MKTCEACGCPIGGARSVCAWCDNALDRTTPVTFVVEHSGERVDWFADGTAVAAAVPVHGLWQILDASGRHVVTLMPMSASPGEESPSLALVGPSARLLGTIHQDSSEGGQPDATTRDHTGETMLVMRGDGPNASHIVDRNGEVVAVSSWGDRSGVTDLLVTASGTRQSLAVVFGLILASELARQAPDRLL